MKKTINLEFLYEILDMIGGVFYREFTKLSGFDGRTALSFVHTHLFLLGMVMFLIVTFCIKLFAIQESKKYRAFIIVYNIGVLLTSLMLAVRGVLQVNGSTLTSAANGMISGFAGIGHILVGIGMILLFLMLKEKVKE